MHSLLFILIVLSSACRHPTLSTTSSYQTQSFFLHRDVKEKIVTVLQGPYPDLQSYCRVRYEESKRKHEQELDTFSHDIPLDSCKGVESTLTERKTAYKASILVIQTHMAGAPIKLCLMAIRTQKGWFVENKLYNFDLSDVCQGVIGPSSFVEKTIDHTMDWKAQAHKHFLSWTYTQYRNYHTKEPVFATDTGISEFVDGKQIESSTFLVLCSIGTSGRPSCTKASQIGCTQTNNQTGLTEYRKLEWSYTNGFLAIHDPNLQCDSESFRIYRVQFEQ